MPRLLAAFAFCVLLAISAGAAAQSLIRFSLPGQPLSLQAPLGWKRNTNAEYLSVESPDGLVALTASAYRREGATLREFADFRFAAVQAFNKQVGPESPLPGGVLREYEGVWPGDKLPTYYVVSARQVGQDFISMTVVTDRADFEKNRALYLQILASGQVAP